MRGQHRGGVEPAVPIGKRKRGIRPQPLGDEVSEVAAPTISAARERRRGLVEASPQGLDDLKRGLLRTVHRA